jgi:8-oxo-dGTP diphosphatase
MNGNKIIVHTLITFDGKYLVTKRSKEESTYPEYWDIPGGLAEHGELPKEAVIRETKEEVGLSIIPTKVVHEDSNLDKVKDLIFIRLVYLCELNDKIENIKLQIEEHSEYRLIKSLKDLEGEKISPFLIELFNKDLENCQKI